MQKSFLYFLIGTAASYVIHYYFLGGQGLALDVYNAAAFGLGWGLAYFVDRSEWALPKKMGISFTGIAALIFAGLLFFNLENAVPAVIKFSTVFVAYYLLASFQGSKSLRR